MAGVVIIGVLAMAALWIVATVMVWVVEMATAILQGITPQRHERHEKSPERARTTGARATQPPK